MTFTTRAAAFLFCVAVTVDQAMAMSWLFPSKPGPSGPSSPIAAPELDGAGAIAVFALVVSVALVLYNRSRNQ